jgi:7-cyano-7-deazaguanine synthase
MSRPAAVVLASGGLDSTTCLALAQASGYEVVALSFDYGQRHGLELLRARAVCEHLGVTRHHIFPLSLFSTIGGSALTEEGLPVPRDRPPEALAAGVPVTYVPARNLVFLSYAVAVAEVARARALYVGVNALDYSGYPDCRPAFVQSFAQTANLATRVGTEGAPLALETPLLHLDKGQIVALARRLGAPVHLTHSCYDPTPEGVACGACDACALRIKGFLAAGWQDPVPYARPVAWGGAAPWEAP